MDGTASLAGVPELIRRLAELNEVGIALSQEKDLDRLLETILVAAKQITRADGGTLYRRHATDRGITAVGPVGSDRGRPAAVLVWGRRNAVAQVVSGVTGLRRTADRLWSARNSRIGEKLVGGPVRFGAWHRHESLSY